MLNRSYVHGKLGLLKYQHKLICCCPGISLIVLEEAYEQHNIQNRYQNSDG